MPDAPKKTQSKIRTFAQDLNAQREKRGEKPVVTSSQKSEPEVIQMAKGPSETVTRKPEPKKAVPPTPEVKPIIEITPAEPPANPTPAPTKIPAFHELQDAVAAIQKNTETQQTAKPIPTKVIGKKSSATQNAPRVNIGYDAKVITDTKKKQFHLFPAIAKSLRSWFAALVKPRKKATPTYSVPDASRRKGVIQKATSKTGSMFTAENTELKEKIRQRKIRAEEEEKARLAAAHEPETTWSPFTETGYELLEEPDVAEITAVTHTAPKNVTIEYKKQRTIEVAPVVAEEMVEEEVTQEIETIPEPVSEEDIVPETVFVNSTDTPEEVPVQIFETGEEWADTETDTVVKQTGINRFDTNTLAIMFVVLIGVIALLVLFIQFTLGLFAPAPESPAPVESNRTISGAQTKNLTLQENQSLTNLINQSVNAEEYGLSDSHIYSQNGNLVSPALVIELLRFDIQASFRQSLTDVSFVHLNQSKPLFVFEFVDEPTVRGGFLAWETNMPEDLQSFYSIPLQNDYSFTDQTVSDIDVRVLLSETGQTLIVYGILNENTALISSSLEDFSQVVETSFTQ